MPVLVGSPSPTADVYRHLPARTCGMISDNRKYSPMAALSPSPPRVGEPAWRGGVDATAMLKDAHELTLSRGKGLG